MSILMDLLTYCRIHAISTCFNPTEESIYRDACRSYSKTFHTPLEDVFKLDPEVVFLANYEEQLSDIDLEENVESLLEQIYAIEDPDYFKSKEDDLQQFIQKVQQEEYEKVSKKQSSKNSLPKIENPIPPDKPIQGSFSADNLNMKNEG
jgi:hypothetical protein